MTHPDDLEVQAAVQSKRLERANAAVPSMRGWRAGLVALGVAVALLLAFGGARAVYTEVRYAAQQQMIAELAAQVEELGGVPVVTADPGTGQPGAVGATGPAGADGADGEPGASGAPGRDGADGEPGVQGQAGSDGSTGATGPQGATGAEGATGAQGPPGAAGVGVQSVTCDETTGLWTVTHTDGTSYNPGGYCVPQPAPQPSPTPTPSPSGEEQLTS